MVPKPGARAEPRVLVENGTPSPFLSGTATITQDPNGQTVPNSETMFQAVHWALNWNLARFVKHLTLTFPIVVILTNI